MGTRRKFIKDCTGLVAAAALLPAAPLRAAPGRPGVSLEALDFPAFVAQLNSRFLLNPRHGAPQILELAEAEFIPGPNPPGLVEQFSLRFLGLAAQALPQDTYQFEHPRLGRFELFIVPVGLAQGRYCRYEAAFNRLRASASAPPETMAHPRRTTAKKSHG